METAIFGGGCFWCTEAVFKELKGVKSVVPGYSGGHVAHPTYRDVCAEDTGHAEVIRIDFDPAVISYARLLDVFFSTHDPTTPDRQGGDVGTRYRSVIFYVNPRQKETAEAVIAGFNDDNTFGSPVVTTVSEAGAFYEAEDYHHDYFENNRAQPYCRMVIAPKVDKFRKFHRDDLR